MKIFSANIDDLKTLYISNLKKALDLEQKIVKALPDLIENSSDQQLASALRTHLEQTKGHVDKVGALLRMHTGTDSADTCKVMVALATEASDTIKDVKDPAVRDIALIGAAQQVEHHEIAVYGTLKNWARVLGLRDDYSTLEFIEKQEFETDDILTQISTSVNYESQKEPALA